jgi:hypothetical protein
MIFDLKKTFKVICKNRKIIKEIFIYYIRILILLYYNPLKRTTSIFSNHTHHWNIADAIINIDYTVLIVYLTKDIHTSLRTINDNGKSRADNT